MSKRSYASSQPLDLVSQNRGHDVRSTLIAIPRHRIPPRMTIGLGEDELRHENRRLDG